MTDPSPKARRSISAVFLLSGFLFASWASRIPYIQHELDLSPGLLGLILLGIPAGALFSIPFTTLLNKRYPSWKVTYWSILLQNIALVLIGFSHSPLNLSLALFFYGVCGNSTNIAMNIQAVHMEALAQKNIMSSFHGFYSLANMIGAFIGGIMGFLAFKPSLHFLISAGIGLLGTLVFAGNLLKTDQVVHDSQRVQKNHRLTLPPRLVLILGFIAFCVMLTEGSVADWSGVYFKTRLHIFGGLNTAGYTAFALAMAISRFSGDWVITRLGASRTVALSGLVMAFGLAAVLFIPQVVAATMGFALVGFGAAAVVPIVYSSVGKIRNIHPGEGLGIVTIIGYIGFLSGPPVIGFLSQAFSLQLAFFFVFLLAIGTIGLARFVPGFRGVNRGDQKSSTRQGSF